MADVRYTVTDLGTLPGYTISSANAVNDAGQIIGTIRVNTKSDKSSEFLWERGQMRRLLGGASASGINNKGQIVGTKWRRGEPVLFGIDFFSHAVTYEKGKPLPLFEQDTDFSSAGAINDSGQVVGHVAVLPKTIEAAADTRSNGYIWQGGERRALPLPPDYRVCKAVAINKQATIVGTASCPDQERSMMEQAVLWEGDEVTLLGALPGFEKSEAVAVNNRQQVLVRAFSYTYQEDGLPLNITFRHFLWDDGRKQEIEGRSVRAFNDHGQVVGSDGWIDFNTGIGRLWAFLWQDGEVFDLNSLIPPDSSWELIHANGINNYGQIVGEGCHNGKEHAFLLTPINQTKEQLGQNA